MLEKAKNILCNEKGMETIEVIGMGVVALIAVALFFNAAKNPMDNITDKINDGLNDINNLGVDEEKDFFDPKAGSQPDPQ
jgi:ArsR family metal-binding transcriptional regulator